MPVGARQAADGSTADRYPPQPGVTAVETIPGRVVFLERGNTDGWIATDSPAKPAR